MENNFESNASQTIGKSMVLASVVRAFFKYFTLGVIESNASDAHDMSVYEPKNIKKAIVPHIESVSAIFNQEAFYAISRLNYDENEIEAELKAFVAEGKTEPIDLMRFACRTQECYDAMVNEYKCNFESLLCGSFATLSPHVAGMVNMSDLGEMSVDEAESIINRIANRAYEEGKKLL